MKKQFLITVFALFAYAATVLGQAVPFTPPQPLTGCDDDPLNPIAGKSYNYSAIADPAGGNFTWWATQDENFITTVSGVTSYNNVAPTLLTVTPDELMATSANYNTPDLQENVDITWTSGLLAGVDHVTNPLFVAVRYEAPAGACADNFKVYEIIPGNGFIVDVLNLDPITHLPDASPYTYEPAQCPDIVRGASWALDVMTYDYGTDTLFYEFVAANFTEYWVPTFGVTGEDAVQGLTYEYTYDLPTTWDVVTVWNPLVSGTTQILTSETTTENGVSVFVRVTVANNDFENLAGQILTMTLDGQNAEGQWDVVNADCTDPGVADQNDIADQTISERPTVTATSGAFE